MINNIIYDLNVFIVKSRMGSEIISLAKELGISGGTIILGKGTVRNSFLKFLEFDECNKDIVLILSDRTKGETLLKKSYLDFKFSEPNTGISFSIPVTQFIGAKGNPNINIESIFEEDKLMPEYNLITVIVDRGNGELVVDAANKKGSKGATIINARGSGIHETVKVFGLQIEPEKEIVLILSEKEITNDICEQIKEEVKIEEPGNGILYVQKVNKAYGLSK